MKRLPRNPELIETLNFHAAVDVPVPGEQRRVSDPSRVRATVAQFEAGLRDSLQSPSRIRGWVSDQLFGLIAADLGGCRLVKQEDAGTLFYEGKVKLPDWRLTLLSGDCVLVEVKAENNSSCRLWKSKLRPAEVNRLRNYAQSNGCPLYIAVHWVAISIWTLVPIDDYIRVDQHYEIALTSALKRNHMSSLLNDRMLGLTPPLEFRLRMKETQDGGGTLGEEREGGAAKTKNLSLVTTGVSLHAGGNELVEKTETSLAWFLIQHANWPCEEKIEELGNGEWEMAFEMAPEEPSVGQGFDIIGSLSELYTRLFYSSTTSLTDETTRLSVEIEPGTLPRLVPTDLKSDRFPLWHFLIDPSPLSAISASED